MKLCALVGLSLVTSAVHFIDNALRLDIYPGPSWFTPAAVALSWFALPLLASIALRLRSTPLLIAFAFSGFLGFEHYLVTPICGVAWRCDATIFAEAGASLLLLVYIIRTGRLRPARPRARPATR